jgi:hypothetical protein
MSEEKAEELTVDEQEIQNAFDEFDVADEVEIDEPEDKAEITEAPEYSPLELEAREDGHTTKDEWTEAGKDPERWKSAHEYVEYGKIKSALDRSKADQDKIREDYDKRFENLNKLHKAETDSKIKALKAEQRKAVEEADTEAFDDAQGKIDDLKVEEVEETPAPKGNAKPAEITDWEARNTWINDPKDPKTQMTQGLYNGFMQANPNSSPKEVVDYIDAQLKGMGMVEAKTNPRRDAPSETGRSPITPKSNGKLSMSGLSNDERDLWAKAGADLWGGDKKAFLQSVADSRRGL